MKQVVEVEGKTVEAAIANGAEQIGVDRELVTYEIIEMPKKGFLGFGETPAKVRVTYDSGNESTALDFVKLLIADMGIDAQVEITENKDSGKEPGSKLIKISGPDTGALIGHHGATLDAIQNITNLVANKKSDAPDEDEPEDAPETIADEPESDEDESGIRSQMTERGRRVSRRYVHITVDVENYRAKREETLRALARRIASKVQRYRRNITLEPMNPYERHIIHSEIQKIKGVTTSSVGSGSDRRVVVYYGSAEPRYKSRGGYRKDSAKPHTDASAETAETGAASAEE